MLFHCSLFSSFNLTGSMCIITQVTASMCIITQVTASMCIITQVTASMCIITQVFKWCNLSPVSTDRVHGPSWRPVNSGAFFDTRVDGPSWRPSTRVVETGLKPKPRGHSSPVRTGHMSVCVCMIEYNCGRPFSTEQSHHFPSYHPDNQHSPQNCILEETDVQAEQFYMVD